MKTRRTLSSLLTSLLLLTAASVAVSSLATQFAGAQNSELQQRLADVKEAAAKNKQALAHYSWQEQETIAIKGDVKDTKVFRVNLGPDGKTQKTEMANLPQSSGGRQHGLAHHVKEKKGEESRNTASRSEPWPSSTRAPIQKDCSRLSSKAT